MNVPLNSEQNIRCMGKVVSKNKTAYKLVVILLSSLMSPLMIYADLQFGS